MDPSLVRGSQTGGAARYDGRSADMPARSSPFETGPRFGGGVPHSAADADEQRALLRALQRAGKPPEKPMHVQTIAAMVSIPWFMFVLSISAVSLFPASTASRVGAWVIVAACLAFSAFLAQVFVYSRKSIYKDLAALGLLAVILASWAGMRIYDTTALEYWMSYARLTFHDVSPSMPAMGYTNAAAVDFTADTKVDLRRPLGYRGAEAGGTVYCVAPILDTASAMDSEVRFWAIGEDCCMPTWGFHCGAVDVPEARSGVVQRKIPGSHSASSRYQIYTAAAAQATAMYSLRAAGDPIFVHWTVDATREINALFGFAILWVASLSLLYLMLSLFLAGWLHWRTGRPRQDWHRAVPNTGGFGSFP